MKMEDKMFSRKVSQLIITFAFFYSAIICHLKAIETLNEGNVLLALFLWFCAITSFMGGLRFQIAKLVIKIKELKKK
tara:strand:+ start:10 stop:240 length:231 start_codon:yes stop_codon:yes gene_type:complete